MFRPIQGASHSLGQPNNSDAQSRNSSPAPSPTPSPTPSSLALPPAAAGGAAAGGGEVAGRASPKEDREERGASTVVFHPGSLYLKVGLANAHEPVVVVHAMAEPAQEGDAPQGGEGVRPDKDSLQGVADELRELLGAPRLRADSLFPDHSTDLPTLEGEDDDEDFVWTDVSGRPRRVYGTASACIHPSEGYAVHFPIRMGRFNTEKHSFQGCATMLGDIWEHTMTQRMRLSLAALPSMSACLVVPSSHVRAEVKAMLDVLFTRFKFKRVVVQQEAICACYAIGSSTACVVDVGHTKTTVCCVDECTLVPNSRLSVPCGGAQVTALLNLLASGVDGNKNRALAESARKPGGALDLLHQANQTYMHNLKHDQVHYFHKETARDVVAQSVGLSQADGDVLEGVTFALPRYQAKRAKGEDGEVARSLPPRFTVSGNAFVVAPMAVFRIKTLGNADWLMRSLLPDQEFVRWQQKQGQLPSSEGRSLAPRETGYDPEDLVMELHEASKLPKEPREGDANNSSNGGDGHTKPFSGPPFLCNADTLEALVQQSIEQTPPDMHGKFYSCIVACGGGAMTPHFSTTLEKLLQHHLDNEQKIVVLPHRLGITPLALAWRGAAVMAFLDIAKDMFVSREEWAKSRARALRERAPFVW